MTQKINQITRDDVGVFVEAGRMAALDHYQEIATKSAIYPGYGTPLGLAYVALKMNGEAGEFAEHVGKAMRDDKILDIRCEETGPVIWDYDRLLEERRAALIKEAGDVLWYLSAACNELGISLSEAAGRNLEKLCDRTERDKLRGSGDDR